MYEGSPAEGSLVELKVTQNACLKSMITNSIVNIEYHILDKPCEGAALHVSWIEEYFLPATDSRRTWPVGRQRFWSLDRTIDRNLEKKSD